MAPGYAIYGTIVLYVVIRRHIYTIYGMTQQLMVIPERVFAPIGQRGRTSLGATIEIIGQSCKELQVTKYQLAGLLGSEPYLIYRWLSGHCTPSSFYLARLTQLWILQWKGLPVHMMRKIR